MVEYLDGGRIQGTSTLTSSPPATSWKLLARGTGSGTTVDTGTFTAKDNLMILIHYLNGTQYVKYNNDTGSNYANRRNEEGGSDSAQPSRTSISFTRNSGEDMFIVGDLVNIAAQEKLGVYHQISENSAGAGNAPKRQEWGHKWTNTSNQITRVTMTSDGGNYSSDDEVVVLGMDNDEADSGTNFWQELNKTSVDSGDELSTGSFTAKKYLWVQFQAFYTGDCNTTMVCNSDTGNNYAQRNSWSGSEGTNTSRANFTFGDSSVHDSIFENIFIVNKSDKEKLMIADRTSLIES